ncbi:MAG: hypothetical protein VSS52_014075 [Thiotrichaceae bacterium]|nr:hypothetical protein [Thiotrichaceae bacterium]
MSSNKCWGVEGCYALLKSRLNLENFTGKTAESVYQDFYAAVYITNLEALDITCIMPKEKIKSVFIP